MRFTRKLRRRSDIQYGIGPIPYSRSRRLQPLDSSGWGETRLCVVWATGAQPDLFWGRGPQASFGPDAELFSRFTRTPCQGGTLQLFQKNCCRKFGLPLGPLPVPHLLPRQSKILAETIVQYMVRVVTTPSYLCAMPQFFVEEKSIARNAHNMLSSYNNAF